MSDPKPPGDGEAHAELVVARRVEVTAEVVMLELRSPERVALSLWTVGAHIDLVLPSGRIRQYSLCGDPTDNSVYVIAVQRQETGRGGSVEVCDSIAVGQLLTVRGPRNHFPMGDSVNYLFIAGGIGITPISAMVREVASAQRDWKLVYGGRALDQMPFLNELVELGGDRVVPVPQDESGFPDIEALVGEVPTGTAIYCCGPSPMLAAVELAVESLRDDVSLHIERFVAPDVAASPRLSFEVELRRSGVTVVVPPEKSILEVVLDTIGDVDFSCEQGICGACETKILEGRPEHHDSLLSEEERESNATMMICVGRSKTGKLVLDL
ncbi:PDR/VanB family oxidoreductase [Rhodococcus globerulus]|uniref:PDR/VanB family oxidoreductase n=1 Tax=Rhodococcus globerulus TaxID=33008 RepID=A0ABU4C4C5_RHOGO|nr:PDR/VanB family oxidoreductase [Rhodococcus globerulus]MDV6271347.1 PDR/VanB family oxidoreductase [Rhodococcus globerulus]